MRSIVSLLLVLLAAGPAWAQNCAVNPLDFPEAVTYTRSAGRAALLLESASHIAPIDGKVCVPMAGMSSARSVAAELRVILNQQGLWSPLVKFAPVASSGETISGWDDASDAMWTSYAPRLAGYGCTPAQVQVMVIWLTEIQQTGDPANGSFSQAQFLDVVEQAFAHNPNLRKLVVSSHPYVGYTTGGSFEDKISEPYVRADAGNLAAWVEQTPLPVDFMDVWSQGDIQHPQHGFTTPCSAVESDGHHPSKVGSAGQPDGGGDNLWAWSLLNRWAADPGWAFTATGYGLPYTGTPPDPVSAPWSGTLERDGVGVCRVIGLNPMGAPVSATVAPEWCHGL